MEGSHIGDAPEVVVLSSPLSDPQFIHCRQQS